MHAQIKNIKFIVDIYVPKTKMSLEKIVENNLKWLWYTSTIKYVCKKCTSNTVKLYAEVKTSEKITQLTNNLSQILVVKKNNAVQFMHDPSLVG